MNQNIYNFYIFSGGEYMAGNGIMSTVLGVIGYGRLYAKYKVIIVFHFIFVIFIYHNNVEKEKIIFIG